MAERGISGHKKKAEAEGGEIFFGDETKMKSNHSFEKSYSLKGQTPVIKKSWTKYSCNVISMLSGKGVMRFMTFKKNFTQNTFLHFLGRMIRKATKKIFLIVDNHRAHHSKKVQKWLEKKRDKIEIHFLPAYCPDMNPTELLNQDLKSNAFRGKMIRDQNELETATRMYLGDIQFNEFKIKNFFSTEKVAFANHFNSNAYPIW
jgi:transposase